MRVSFVKTSKRKKSRPRFETGFVVPVFEVLTPALFWVFEDVAFGVPAFHL